MNPDFQSKRVWSSVINIKNWWFCIFACFLSRFTFNSYFYSLRWEKLDVFLWEGEGGDFVFVAANNDQISKLYPCVPTFMYTYFYNLDHST